MDEKTHEPLLSILTLIVETAVKLRKDGHKVIIVSSGAVGVGLQRMDIENRPKHLPQIQVCIIAARRWKKKKSPVLYTFLCYSAGFASGTNLF